MKEGENRRSRRKMKKRKKKTEVGVCGPTTASKLQCERRGKKTGRRLSRRWPR
jgi:hypothetical protein